MFADPYVRKTATSGGRLLPSCCNLCEILDRDFSLPRRPADVLALCPLGGASMRKQFVMGALILGGFLAVLLAHRPPLVSISLAFLIDASVSAPQRRRRAMTRFLAIVTGAVLCGMLAA